MINLFYRCRIDKISYRFFSFYHSSIQIKFAKGYLFENETLIYPIHYCYVFARILSNMFISGETLCDVVQTQCISSWETQLHCNTKCCLLRQSKCYVKCVFEWPNEHVVLPFLSNLNMTHWKYLMELNLQYIFLCSYVNVRRQISKQFKLNFISNAGFIFLIFLLITFGHPFWKLVTHKMRKCAKSDPLY